MKGRPVPPHGSGPAQVIAPRGESDFDVCYCGDYRHQHVDGKGRCNLNWAHAYSGYCSEFRLSKCEPEKQKEILSPTLTDEKSKGKEGMR